MSNRDSLGFGDLLPQDVVDIFAQEKHKRGKKKRSHSLGRALGWLKGKKKKDLDAKGGLGLGPALDLAVDGHPTGHQGQHKGGQRSGRQAHPQAVPKLVDDKTPAPPSLQENVFVEASRPEYLENLHSEALEGLKMMQQEETDQGVEYRDNESTISMMTVQTDGEGGGFVTDSTIADTTSVISVQSSVSTRSSRSGLTRQKSTFRPLNSGNKPEKTKKRKRHRKTIGAIPQHVQMELGLDRGGWTVAQRLDEEQLYNGDPDNSPTTDVPQQAVESQNEASGSSENTNTIQPINRDQIKQRIAPHAGHRDDMALLKCLGPNSTDEQRPRSVAVPWMTTANSLQPELPSPVMSMSPQAAYMSKIIPNAVLPPSIDVVEISRGRSRNSVRTVSKSSLLLSSPAPSRASSKASSRASSRASTVNSPSQPQNMSDSSCWSHSDSSETLVSDSSTISRNSTPQTSPYADGFKQDGQLPLSSSLSQSSACASNGKVIVKGEVIKKEGQFIRSLSVMKPKRAPPPPNRSYSLYNKMKRRSRDLMEVAAPVGESSHHKVSASGEENVKNKYSGSRNLDSPGYNADTSSLDDSTGSASVSPIRPQAGKAEAAVSKGASQQKQESLQENKLSEVSPSSGYSSQDGKRPHGSSSKHKKGILAKLQRLFPGSSPVSTRRPLTQPVLPENSKLKEDLKSNSSVETASVSPSVRTLIELFNIPPHPKVHAPPPPPPEVWAHSKRSFELLLGPPAPDNLHAIIKKNPKDRRQQRNSSSSSTESSVKSLVERKHKSLTATVETKKVQESMVLNAEIQKEYNDRLANQNVDLKGNSKVTEKDEKVRVRDMLNGMLVKAVERREGRLAAVKEEEAKTSTQVTEVDSSPAISLKHTPPSLPAAYNPSHPPTNQTSGKVVSPEFSWPPPPPPIGLSASRDFELPLPPPPVFSEEVLVMPVQVPPERSIPGGDASSTTTSVLSECVRLTAEAEPQKPSGSQGALPVVLNIPPPPPYTAPPPPIKAVPPPTIKKISPPFHEDVSPPPKDVFRIQPKIFSTEPPGEVAPAQPKEVPPPPLLKGIPLPPLKEVSSLPSKEVLPPPPIAISLPPPKEVPPPPTVVSLPPPQEVPPPPPTVVSLPPPQEVPPPPPTVVSLPPPKEVPPPPPTVVSLPPPKEVPPPPPTVVSLPPPKEVPPPPPTVVSLPPPKEVPPPPPTVVSLPPPKEVPPPPPAVVSFPPPKEVPPPPAVVSLPPPEKVPPSPPKEVSLTPPEEVSPPLVKEVSTTSVRLVSPPSVEISPLPPKELSVEVVPPPSSQVNVHDSSEETPPVSELAPPENIPPPPPIQAQSPEETVPSKSDTDPSSINSTLNPPPSIPPPPQELLIQPQIVPTKNEGPVTQEVQSPPSDVSIQPTLESSVPTEGSSVSLSSPPVNIPLPTVLPVEGLGSIENQPNPANSENQTAELTSTPVVQEKPTVIVTPSILQVVKLRSVSNSPEPPKAQEVEATVSNQVPTSSASGETPQKPIRKSLIATSPTSSSPPVVVISQAAHSKSESTVIQPASSPTAVSPTVKSPPATIAAPSMNLQEAIRLRTAARSQTSSAPRISLHSQTSPTGFHKSPTSTASFIFSKSNKRAMIETRHMAGERAAIKKNLEGSSVTKVMDSEAELVKKGVKVPPPVAKKPKTMGKEVETSVGTEQTAGQEALKESITDAEEKTNGTAGTVGETPST
ncbi:NHS-like protein 3 isoform X2 [Antennarius striatus]|uniref:NHS-like protein 3 isoform X2 n=1 Tax=Antennarius striatus TaxID=241820 RepID=UPI0035B35161